MGAIPSYASATDELAELRRRVSDLEGGSRLGNSAIVAGALIARDGTGTERARFGQLTDGTFGVTGRIVGSEITVVDTDGTEMPVGQALFGIRVATQGAAVGITATTPATYTAVGPEVAVLTPTGKILISGSARIQGNGSITDGPIAALQIRSLDGTEVYAPGTAAGKIAAFAESTGQPVTVPLIGLVSGLTPGATYLCRFLYAATGTGAGAGSASSAIIVAQPY